MAFDHYRVWQQGDKYSAKTFHAFDHEDAANDWAHEAGKGRGYEEGPEGVRVVVEGPDGSQEIFEIEVDYTPVYSAFRVA